MLLPYRQAESVPLRPAGILRQGFGERDADTNIRALCISQILSLRLHSTHLRETASICVVGGGAKNRFLMQLIADVFQARAYKIHHGGFAAPLGCAISAARMVMNLSYREAAQRYVQRDDASVRIPHREAPSTVQHLLRRYRKLEALGSD